MKSIKKALIIIICICVSAWSCLFPAVLVEAVTTGQKLYVAIGDSITSGYGLESFQNNDLKNKNSTYNFVTKLGRKLGMKTLNLGVEGVDSTMLLKAISNPSTEDEKNAVAQIRNANLITLSIGGNNVFIPLLNSINDGIGNGKNIFNANATEIQNALIKLLFNEDEIEKLKKNISNGADVFADDAKAKKTGDFSKIISTVKTLNPKAKIVVQTIYNPYDLIFADSIGTAINRMNAEIVRGSENGKNYKVADVYSAFNKAKAETQLVNADTGKSFDPHPTQKGHEVIYTLVAYAAGNDTLPYSVKLNIVKGKASVRISAGELLLTFAPSAGYKLPKSIFLTIGKSQKTALVLKNGVAAVPIADVGTDITVTAVCTK
ncbi:MAG: lipolytic protein family [Eubacterium sp.]|jgi:lysophospholipase L1-like esterase|nr:lipolytic protein family [Eubacterium sp.]